MKKLTWSIVVIIVLAGVYLLITKTDISKKFTPNNGEEIPQPPKLPE